jgi:exonuclease VII large subunit
MDINAKMKNLKNEIQLEEKEIKELKSEESKIQVKIWRRKEEIQKLKKELKRLEEEAILDMHYILSQDKPGDVLYDWAQKKR